MNIFRTFLLTATVSVILSGCSSKLQSQTNGSAASTADSTQPTVQEQTTMTGSQGTTVTSQTESQTDTTQTPALSTKDDTASLQTDLKNTTIVEEKF